MKSLLQSAWEALFLSETPYEDMRDHPSPIKRGLFTVLLIAVLAALVGLVGTTLEWATTPAMDDIQATVLEGIQNMPWYRQLEGEPEFRQQFSQWYETSWRIFPQLFGAPDIATAGLSILLLPLGITLTWALYGVLAYIPARWLGGEGSLGQTLGCTALAVAPQLFNLATLFPYVAVGGLIGTWTLLCRYTALKTCHRLPWNRALIATLVPYVIFSLFVALFSCLGGVVAGALFAGGTQR